MQQSITAVKVNNKPIIDNILMKTVYQMLEVEGEMRFINFEPALLPCLSTLSHRLVKKIDSYIESHKNQWVKKFDYRKTVLTQNQVDDIWHAISVSIGTEIKKSNLNKNHAIDGLEMLVNDGVILFTKHLSTVRKDDYETMRRHLNKKLPVVNDFALFLERFRNNLYLHWQKEFGVRTESKNEIRREVLIK